MERGKDGTKYVYRRGRRVEENGKKGDECEVMSRALKYRSLCGGLTLLHSAALFPFSAQGVDLRPNSDSARVCLFYK